MEAKVVAHVAGDQSSKKKPRGTFFGCLLVCAHLFFTFVLLSNKFSPFISILPAIAAKYPQLAATLAPALHREGRARRLGPPHWQRRPSLPPLRRQQSYRR